MKLGVAHVGLSEADARRLKSTLAMAVLNKASLEYQWHFSDAESACLVVLGVDSAESMAWLEANSEDGQKTHAVLAGESDELPAGAIRLPWPIRLEDLLRLLRASEKRGRDLRSADSSASTSPAHSDIDSENHILRLASVVRDTDNAESSTAWQINGVTKRSIYISPGEKAFYCDVSLVGLRELDSSMRLQFLPMPIEEVRGKPNKKPLEMLQWLVGLQTGGLGLLPWISKDMALRLRRYPAFHLLHHTPTHRRLATTLSRPRDSIETIARLASVATEEACGFVNAMSLCGYLLPNQELTTAAATKNKSTGRSHSLIRSFRKALGIGVASV